VSVPEQAPVQEQAASWQAGQQAAEMQPFFSHNRKEQRQQPGPEPE